MKIKSDFVTNSSSTSYVVCMPPTFQITFEMVEGDEYDFKYLLKEYETEGIENPKETCLKNLNDALKHLKENGMMWMDHVDAPAPYTHFHIISNAIDNSGYKINSFNTGSDDGMIINVLADTTIEKVMNALIDKTLLQFEVKGKNDVTTKD